MRCGSEKREELERDGRSEGIRMSSEFKYALRGRHVNPVGYITCPLCGKRGVQVIWRQKPGYLKNSGWAIENHMPPGINIGEPGYLNYCQIGYYGLVPANEADRFLKIWRVYVNRRRDE